MKNRVVIVHGWDGYPEEGWFPWLRHELEVRGHEVIVPQLPVPEEPRIDRWVPALRDAVGDVNTQTFFIGHSMGCQTIARFLADLPYSVCVGGVVLVAGFFTELTNLESDDVVRDVVKEWLQTPLDLERVRLRAKHIAAIFSDNDQYVPLSNRKKIETDLDALVIVEHGKGHFSGFQGITELPSALDTLLGMMK